MDQECLLGMEAVLGLVEDHASRAVDLLLVSTPGSASIIAEAIDRSTMDGPEGTVAGDNTVLVLFADADRLERWRERLAELSELPPG